MVIFFCFLINYKANCQQGLPPNDPNYYLAWADSFSTTQIDSNKWLKSFPWHQQLNYEFFAADTAHLDTIPTAAIRRNYSDSGNCKIGNGTLKLITRKENYLGEVWNWPGGTMTIDTLSFKFTTAMLYSKWDFRYGYFEIRFKLPNLQFLKTMQGHGATFWLWNGDNNVYREIDAYEINGYNHYNGKSYTGWGNSHFGSNGHDPNSDPTPVYTFTGGIWHTVGINWTTNAIDYYYDGVLQYESYNHPDSLLPMSIIITCGGNYAPVDNFSERFDTTANGTYFPFTYEIDYVKVWQLKKDCNKDTTLVSYNTASYPNKLHKSITMGTNFSVTNQNYQSFWASNYILLNDVTYIDANSNVLYNTNDCNSISFDKKRKSSSIVPVPDAFLLKLKMHY